MSKIDLIIEKYTKEYGHHCENCQEIGKSCSQLCVRDCREIIKEVLEEIKFKDFFTMSSECNCEMEEFINNFRKFYNQILHQKTKELFEDELND